MEINNGDTIKSYYRMINRFPLITREEEVELAARIKKGEKRAKEKLIESNLRLVVKIAHNFKGLGLPLQDLISEGNIGMIRAVEKFDPAKGAKFSSYASWWIKQGMRRAINNQAKTVRIPVQSNSKIIKIRKAENVLTEDLSRKPTDKELAEYTGYTIRTIISLKSIKTTTISIDAPIEQYGKKTFEEIYLGQEDPEFERRKIEELAKNACKLLPKLEKRERLILTHRFGLNGQEPKTLESVSKLIGRTRERVRQLQQKALSELNRLMDKNTTDYEKETDFSPIIPIETKGKIVKIDYLHKKREKTKTKLLKEKVVKKTENLETIISTTKQSKEIKTPSKITKQNWKTDYQRFKRGEIKFVDPTNDLLYKILSELDGLDQFEETIDLIYDVKQKLVLDKLYVENQDYKQTASQLNWSEEEVKQTEYEGIYFIAKKLSLLPEDNNSTTPLENINSLVVEPSHPNSRENEVWYHEREDCFEYHL